jgi:hypothetical protein
MLNGCHIETINITFDKSNPFLRIISQNSLLALDKTSNRQMMDHMTDSLSISSKIKLDWTDVLAF